LQTNEAAASRQNISSKLNDESRMEKEKHRLRPTPTFSGESASNETRTERKNRPTTARSHGNQTI
jgi:hypothetical protein